MGILRIYDEQGAVVDGDYRTTEEIARQLGAINVLFEAWETAAALPAEAAGEAVLDAYRESVERLKARYGFQSVDVVSLGPDHPEREALRRKFLAEHTHHDFEVRFFVAGSGLFYIHAGERVYGVLCERGDLISVPAGVPHWFDMGGAPDFKCIRFFTTPEGWVAEFTGSDIAARFPDLDAFCQAVS